LKKDRCVFSSADERTRCKAPPKQHPSPVKQVSHFPLHLFHLWVEVGSKLKLIFFSDLIR
jgi:hypothetical protein